MPAMIMGTQRRRDSAVVLASGAAPILEGVDLGILIVHLLDLGGNDCRNKDITRIRYCNEKGYTHKILS